MTSRTSKIVTAVAAAGIAGGASAGGWGPEHLPVPVWNQAYQENYAADSIAEIRADARDGYVLIDPFPAAEQAIIAETIGLLHDRDNQVGAYISIGTGEDWREDFEALKPYLVTRQWDEWGGEFFVKMPEEGLVALMKARIDRIADWGFDWVEFDNMDWVYDATNRAQFGISADIGDAVAYYRDLCAHAHARGLKCMAKNNVNGAEMFDGAIYESYEDNKNWWNEAGAAGFLADGKLVIIVHYDAVDCDAVYAEYQAIYGAKLSFICEDRKLQRYRHFNTRTPTGAK